jgi:hypothetical protein
MKGSALVAVKLLEGTAILQSLVVSEGTRPSAADQAPLPTLLLIARGAKTGKLRPLPLLYQEIDGKYVNIGSKGARRSIRAGT